MTLNETSHGGTEFHCRGAARAAARRRRRARALSLAIEVRRRSLPACRRRARRPALAGFASGSNL